MWHGLDPHLALYHWGRARYWNTFQQHVEGCSQAQLGSGSYRKFLVELACPRIEFELADQADDA